MMHGPLFPRMIRDRVFAIRREILHQLASFGFRETSANADMLQHAEFVETAKQKGADRVAITFPVPSKAGNDAITIALVLDLEHHALVRLINTGCRLRDNAIEPRAFKASKPVGREGRFFGCGCYMYRRRSRCKDRFQLAAAFFERHVSEISVVFAKQIKEHDRCWDLL